MEKRKVSEREKKEGTAQSDSLQGKEKNRKRENKRRRNKSRSCSKNLSLLDLEPAIEGDEGEAVDTDHSGTRKKKIYKKSTTSFCSFFFL